jgi:hypothetical protein
MVYDPYASAARMQRDCDAERECRQELSRTNRSSPTPERKGTATRATRRQQPSLVQEQPRVIPVVRTVANVQRHPICWLWRGYNFKR